MPRQTRKLSHHKRAHNGRHRVRKGDIFQPRPSKIYRRPCGCSNSDVPRKNKLMLNEILQTKHVMKWLENGWGLNIPDFLSRKFGRCIKHLTEVDKKVLKGRGLTI